MSLKRCLICETEHPARDMLCSACTPSYEAARRKGQLNTEAGVIGWVAARTRTIERRHAVDEGHVEFLEGLLREARRHLPAGPIAELIDRTTGDDA